MGLIFIGSEGTGHARGRLYPRPSRQTDYLVTLGYVMKPLNRYVHSDQEFIVLEEYNG